MWKVTPQLGRVPQKMPGTKLDISVQKSAVLATVKVLLSAKYSSYGQIKSLLPFEGGKQCSLKIESLSVGVNIDHIKADRNSCKNERTDQSLAIFSLSHGQSWC